MARVFEGAIHVHYGQAYVIAGENALYGSGSHFLGQSNGLCGAAVPGELFLVTGLHTGEVGFTIDVLDAPPPLDDAWEEIVEVSFFVADTDADVALVEWGGGDSYPIPLSPGNYRVRYCARGMQIGRERDTSLEGEGPYDFYSLAFWPADPAEDRILKQTSEVAAYWHKANPEMSKRIAESPPPPLPPPTPAPKPPQQIREATAYSHEAGPEMSDRGYASPAAPEAPPPVERDIFPMSADLKPKILYSEKARYTDEARTWGVEGKVILQVIFRVDGTITGIRVRRGLPHGLTETAIEAARKIKFEPAEKDGRPVNIMGTLEFKFSLYSV